VPHVCRSSYFWRQYGSQDWQIIRRGPSTWLVRIYVGRDPGTRKRNYIGKSIQGGLRAAQAHLNHMLAERDLGRNTRSSRQTPGQYLDHWLDICTLPRLHAKSFRDYSSLLMYVRPGLYSRPLGELSTVDIEALYSELLNRNLSARTIRYTHAVLFSALRQAVRWKLILSNPAEDIDLPRQPRRRSSCSMSSSPSSSSLRFRGTHMRSCLLSR
jgi:hypothetical protein